MRGPTQRQEDLLPSGHSDKETRSLGERVPTESRSRACFLQVTVTRRSLGEEGPHRDKRTCFLQVTVTRGSLGERVHTEARGSASFRSQ